MNTWIGYVGRADYTYDACVECINSQSNDGNCPGPEWQTIQITPNNRLICEKYSECDNLSTI